LLDRLEAGLLRWAAPLAHPRATRRAAFIVPLLCGLLSLAMGQDDGWDMRNYHLYNVHALLNGRMALDMSPAGFQSYFNPLLDVPYFLLTKWLPAPVAGFVFGVLHGLAFVLVAAIVRQFVANGRTALLLAIAGMMSAAFLSELGNSMGDNLTALLVLGSLYWLLRRWEQLPACRGAGLRALLGAGAVMGLGLGLKLTNATFAVGACVALLVLSAPLRQRALAAFLYGVGVLAGMAATSGYWMFRMWSSYGNPLFPQFNNIFHSPMAAELGVLDEGHLPRSPVEALLWPFVFTRNISRIAEVPIQQIIWPLLYTAVVVWAVVALLRRVQGARGKAAAQPALAPRALFLLVFFAVSYVVWVRLFSIYRYLVPIELLAPLLFWLLLEALAPQPLARRLGGWLLLAAALAVLPFTTWGHAGWTERAFTADAPRIAQPAQAVVLQTYLDSPIGWLAQFMPSEAAVVGLDSGFPESKVYRKRMQQLIASRGGPHYIMFPIATDKRATGMERKAQLAGSLGLTGSESGCRALEWLTSHVRMKAEVDRTAAPSGQLCTLALQARYRKDTAPEDRAMEAEAARRLRLIGLAYDPATCVVYRASVGMEPYPYRMCAVGAVQ
jgi:hypothetical protein